MFMTFFQAGGIGMYATTVIGLVTLGIAALAARRPTAGKLAALRNLPTLLMTSGLLGFATGLWKVGQFITDASFVKAAGVSGDQLPLLAWLGMGESATNLAWAGAWCFFAVLLRMAAEVKLARAQG